jgi:anti-anti-sigma factor
MSGYASELLSVTLEEARGVPVVSATGELDIASVPELRAAFLEATTHAGRGHGETNGGTGQKPVVADLRRLSFMDSMGLGLLMEIRKIFGELGIGLRLVAEHGDAAYDLLKATALYEAFEVYQDREPALDA